MVKEIVIKTEYELLSISGEASLPNADTGHLQWVSAAKEGQVIKLKDGLGVITREALESSVGTWKDGYVFDDHKTIHAGFQIHGDKFISPYLYFLLDEVIVAHLGKSAGGSIDAFATRIEGDKVTGMKGRGYSILSPGLMPSCTREAGCGIPIAGTAGDVNITTKDGENIGNNDKADLQQKIEGELKNKGGHKGNMADEKQDVTFSAKQVAEVKAAAVAEVTEQLGNAHKAGVADIEAANAAELKTLEEAHTTELETQRELVTKQVGLIESLSAQYSLSDEAKKALTDAKTLEDALALFAGLKITEPIAGEGAAEGGNRKNGDKADKGGGVVQGGAVVEGQAPKTVKIEEVGNWDAYTQKYVPTFREEVI